MSVRYRRPPIVFYLPSPPVGEELAARFRSAPRDLTPAEQGQLNAFVRDLRTRQDLLRDALEDSGDAEPVDWIRVPSRGLRNLRPSPRASAKF